MKREEITEYLKVTLAETIGCDVRILMKIQVFLN